jgi:monoterpene epsilon-lactone hydrolase
MLTRHVRLRRSLLLVVLAMAPTVVLTRAAWAQATSASSIVAIEQSGAVQVPAHVVPISEMLSPEGKAYVTEHLLNMQRPEMIAPGEGVPPLSPIHASTRTLRGRAARSDDRWRACL